MRLRDLGEFELIERIAQLAGRSAGPSPVLGIGDDAAILRLRAGEDAVVTTDTLVEGVHFRFATQAARTLGRRALAANLSDLAAMGARPLGCTLALAAPASLEVEWVLEVVRGLLALARRHACPLVGGDVTRARQTQLAIGVTGAVARGRALTRHAARPGDRILVTGTLGGAALELALAERGLSRVRRVPEPRVAAGRALARLRGAGACIDVSDGLLVDLRHVLDASGVGAELDLSRIPTPRGFAAACARAGLPPERLAQSGGEDYELLFTVRASAPSAAQLSRRLGVRVTEIGRVRRRDQDRVSARPAGWRHF